MTIDQKLRDASTAMTRATADADYSVTAPGTRPSFRGPVVAVLGAAALFLVIGLPAMMGLGGSTQVDRQVGSGSGDATVPTTAVPTTVTPPESDIEQSLTGDDAAETQPEDTPIVADGLSGPADSDWTALTSGVSFAWVAETDTDARLWVRSNVADPIPASSTDALTMFVPVNADTTAMLINAAYEQPDSVEAVLSDGTVVSLAVSWDNPDIGMVLIPSPFDPYNDTVTWVP